MAPGWIWYGITEHILIHRMIYMIYHVIHLNISWYIGILYTPSRDICWVMTGHHQWKVNSRRVDNIWTSAASERLFSVAGNTITEKRSRLTDENAENTIFLHSNQPMWWYTWQQYCHAVVKLSVVWLVLRLSSGSILCFAAGRFSSFGGAPGSDRIAVSTSCFSSHFFVQQLFSFVSKWYRFVCCRDEYWFR